MQAAKFSFLGGEEELELIFDWLDVEQKGRLSLEEFSSGLSMSVLGGPLGTCCPARHPVQRAWYGDARLTGRATGDLHNTPESVQGMGDDADCSGDKDTKPAWAGSWFKTGLGLKTLAQETRSQPFH